MLKFRNMLIIIVCSYVIMVLALLMAERSHVVQASSNAYTTISLAADLALSQAAASDEFFNDKTGLTNYNDIGQNKLYATKGVTSVRTNNCKNNTLSYTYTDENIFHLVYNLDKSDTDSSRVLNERKKKLYKDMYARSDSMLNQPAFIQEVAKITTPIGKVDVPNIARIGLMDPDLGLSSSTKLREIVGNEYVAKTGMGFHTDKTNYTTGYNTNTDWLGLFSIAKAIDSYAESQNPATYNDYYYLAPTNVGITYLDPYILQTAFVSNMDLLMRAESVAATDDEGNTTGGVLSDLNFGIPLVNDTKNGEGTAYALTASEWATVIDQNIITDGTFSFVKGHLGDNGSTRGWTGGITKSSKSILPTIEYKVINMSDPANMSLVRLAVGIPAGVDYDTWLDEIGVQMQPGSSVREDKYIVVAKVTFYADIIVSYSNTITREYYSMYADRPTNDKFFSIKMPELSNESDDMVSGVTGNRYFQYTTYFAIVP